MTRWEPLRHSEFFDLSRSGRFLVSTLRTPHRVLSTSVRHGGLVEHVRHLLNHQSCEASAHGERHRVMTDRGLDAYHDIVCAEAGLAADATAVMGTAANMNYAAVVSQHDGALEVTAIVTAGVQGNAMTAGEPATWREADGHIERVPMYAGTINTLVLVNQPVTTSAHVRAAVTMTEAKTAALHRLAVSSKAHTDLATGTGTDQFCLAAPLDSRPPLTSASPHMKLGELIGSAVRDATLEALRWQNGLEPSYARGLFHALGRYGVREATLLDDIAPLLSPHDLELLQKNIKAACFEPMAGAAAHALATVCDRVRFGMLPAPIAAEAMTQQAALVAANMAAQPHRVDEFRRHLRPHADSGVKTLTLAAIALGWTEKWRGE